MKIICWKDESTEARQKILSRKSLRNDDLRDKVADIISAVKRDGDQALVRFSQKFDGINLEKFQVTKEEFKAGNTLELKYKRAIRHAIENIADFHQKQLPKKITHRKAGIVCEKKYTPIERVGLYIPAGSAPLVSSLMMLAIPANIAGCKFKVIATPPDKSGSINKAILFTAQELGINSIFKVGGAQAVAALAYGTESIPKVDKIFGPGNKYVTEAKQQVTLAGTAIDMPAGPSEVLVIADKSANPKFIASDLLAQAEHDSEAQAVLITDNSDLAKRVLAEIPTQLAKLSRKTIASKALENSFVILVADLNEAFVVSNLYAPEHLILHLKNAASWVKKVTNAGSVFVGEFSAEACGDYASGTNHVLPTAGYARSYGGVSVESFMKSMTIQTVSKNGLRQLGSTVMALAELEGLDAHRNAVAIRLDKTQKL